MEHARDYAALPHEYIEEMAALDDAEFGRLVRALLEYSRSGAPMALCGNERFYAVRVMNREDRYQQSYRQACERRSSAGRIGAAARWSAHERTRPDAAACRSVRREAGNGKTETEAETNTETETDSDKNGGDPARPRGEYGWVMLSDAQYETLIAELGREEAERCIAYVDECAQSTGNKNRWRDWALTVRRCHRDGWGLQTGGRGRAGRVQSTVPENIEELLDGLDRI